MAEGNFHAALNIALSALNACRKGDDQAGIDRCLDTIMEITARLACEFGSEEYLGRA
ncbi:MAG: hypothetical protein ACTSXZ_00010 [Alphaproteobacteria bacterium]